MNYRIDLAEMDAHAKRVDEIGGRIGTAIGAGDAASNPEAFGLLGIPLAALCRAAQHMAMNTLKDAAEAALDHHKRVKAWRENAGFGSMFEHIGFLKEPLDWLTGDQQTLDGMAQTWSSVSSYLDEISTDLKNAVNNDAGQWVGQDSAKYREVGADRADTYGAVGTAARGMSILISICIRWAPAMAPLGAGIAGAVAEGVPVAVRYAQKCIEWCRKLTRAFGKRAVCSRSSTTSSPTPA